MQRPLNFTSQDKLFNPGCARPVTLIGCGSVGSWVLELLPRVGCTDITVYDDDDVASHNVPSGNFGLRDAMEGSLKAGVVAERVAERTGISARVIPEPYVGQPLSGSVICCVDKMDQRAKVWLGAREGVPLVDFFVDTRTHEAYLHVIRVRPDDEAQRALYDRLLYPNKGAEPPMCGRGNNPLTAFPAAWAAVALLTAGWNGGTTFKQFRMRADMVAQLTP